MPDSFPSSSLVLEVLQQFRLIYGSMRQHFRLVEERCGMSGSQMWVLQEVQRSPGLGISELAGRMGIHQSTCSLLVDKLVANRCLSKERLAADQRRVGLALTPAGQQALASLPGPAEGILPEALSRLSTDAVQALHQDLAGLIRLLPAKDEHYANTPLADLLRAREEH